MAEARGLPVKPTQPGMSDEWAARIFAADSEIKSPKPDWPERTTLVLNKGFDALREISPGKYEFVVAKGTYPNRAQIKRVLNQGVVARCMEIVSTRTFEIKHRAHTGYAHMGIGGPSHQWVIDSTVGDVYLRCSLNRAWVIGRPIVYVIVDTWSTAVVGFHVCLSGPSWEMASVALFNAAVGEATLSSLLGVERMPLLSPEPAWFYDLLADRGEYLSKGERALGRRLNFKSSYTRANTPYLKGIVEVLHRIAKDKTYYFVPGAFDMRRDEWLRNKRAFKLSAMTIGEYTNYLHTVFLMYNLLGDRRHRLDARMIAEHVSPTPAGLWRWAYDAGLAFRKVIPQDDLIWNLLPAVRVTVNGDGVFHGGCKYGSADTGKLNQWSTLAKNSGTYSLEGRYFPGAMRSVWVREREGSALSRLDLHDQARVSPDLSRDEWLDALSLQTAGQPDREHEAQKIRSKLVAEMDYIVQGAKAATSAAIANQDSYPAPTPSEARALEVGGHVPSLRMPHASNVKPAQSLAVDEWKRELAEEHEKAMRDALENANLSI